MSTRQGLPRLIAVVLAGAALQVLTACGERSQILDASGKKTDAAPWTVSSSAEPNFAAKGWKAGDKAAWEAQIRKRNQAQNEYAR